MAGVAIAAESTMAAPPGTLSCNRPSWAKTCRQIMKPRICSDRTNGTGWQFEGIESNATEDRECGRERRYMISAEVL